MPKYRCIDRASIIQNGLSREECEALFKLLDAAEGWREVMVRINQPCDGYPDDDPDGAKYWTQVRNHNGRLVQAVDELRSIIGSTRSV